MSKLDMPAVTQLLAEARNDVTHADQKASVLLAALGIGYGAIIGGQLSAQWDSGSLSPAGQVIFWVGVIVAALSVGAAALVIWPRYKLDDHPEHGLTYWGHVAAFDDMKELEQALEKQGSFAEERTLHQLWRISRLVLKKYRALRLSLLLGALSGVLLGLATIIIR